MSEQHDAKYMGDNLFFADKSPHKIETSEIMKKNLYNRVKHWHKEPSTEVRL